MAESFHPRTLLLSGILFRWTVAFKDVIYNQPVRGYFLQQWVSCASQADTTFSEHQHAKKNRLCRPFPVVTVRFFSQSRAVHGGSDMLLIHGCCSG